MRTEHQFMTGNAFYFLLAACILCAAIVGWNREGMYLAGGFCLLVIGAKWFYFGRRP